MITGTEWLVVLAGLAAIAWVNWYFFVAEGSVAVAAASGRGGSAQAASIPAEVAIVVEGGYSPAAVRVRAGEPVRLVFERREESGCSEEIVIPDLGIRRFLPPFQKTAIEVTPPAPGTYPFTCGMSMLRGKLIAEE